MSMQQIGVGSGLPATQEVLIQNMTGGTTRSNFWVAYGSTVDNVTGDATIAALLISAGTIELSGSYTMSGAQPTELSIDIAALTIGPGASISGTGNISITNGGFLVVDGTLSGSVATFTNGQVILETGSVFNVGTLNLNTGSVIEPRMPRVVPPRRNSRKRECP